MNTNALIDVQHVSMCFRHQTVLHNISLTLNTGQTTVLLGPNGSGKSTLLKIMLGLLSPTSGHIWQSPQLRIGYVPQHLHIDNVLPLTVDSFLRLSGSRDRTRRHAQLAAVQADHLYHQSIQQLSGGEKQRVLLARALLREPQLLVLDEPMQGVDSNGQKTLYDLLVQMKVQQKCSILMVSHDTDTALHHADQALYLDGGLSYNGPSMHFHPALIAQAA